MSSASDNGQAAFTAVTGTSSGKAVMQLFIFHCLLSLYHKHMRVSSLTKYKETAGICTTDLNY